MNNLLVVVDMQNDFVDEALGTEEAVGIVADVVEKIGSFNGIVCATRDTHPENYMETQEGKNLQVVHCVKGTHGWEICDAVKDALADRVAKGEDVKIFDKPTFGSTELATYVKDMDEKDGVACVTLIGLCTGICVLSNAITIKANAPEIPLIVDAKCCACVTPQSHKTALEAMKLCQVKVINE